MPGSVQHGDEERTTYATLRRGAVAEDVEHPRPTFGRSTGTVDDQSRPDDRAIGHGDLRHGKHRSEQLAARHGLHLADGIGHARVSMVRVLGWVRREVELAESVSVARDLVGADRMHVDRRVQRWRLGEG